MERTKTGKPSASKSHKKVSVFLKKTTIPKVKTAAKRLGTSLTDFVSDATEQRLASLDKKRKAG